VLQLTGDLTWANDKVPLMQQSCVDDILNTAAELNDTDTEAAINETRRRVEVELSPYICESFECNGNGRCVNGTCVCNQGKTFISVISENTIRYMQITS